MLIGLAGEGELLWEGDGSRELGKLLGTAERVEACEGKAELATAGGWLGNWAAGLSLRNSYVVRTLSFEAEISQGSKRAVKKTISIPLACDFL
jgi:hypothetical protein